ncbi:hypothetical protein [Undibacterium sp. RuRC25W]|uniref:hypothetical protein n=1 Tax=Undibacterium sp. RuRC25W TaxID=3413047 RepID=UPI003BF45D04
MQCFTPRELFSEEKLILPKLVTKAVLSVPVSHDHREATNQNNELQQIFRRLSQAKVPGKSTPTIEQP